MKTLADCLDLSLLSLFLDHELGEEEQEKIRQHLEHCPECRTKGEHLAGAEKMVRTALTRPQPQPSPQTPSQECLSPELISAYVQRVLFAEEGVRVEKHLQNCNRCLTEVMEAFQISSSLASVKREPVPAMLKDRVASQWEAQPVQEQAAPLSRLVIQVAQKGLRLLEKRLVAPLVEVMEISAPLPAYRAEEVPETLTLRITTDETAMRVTAVQEGKGMAFTLTLLGAGEVVLAGQRIFLRQQGRSIFSAKTDEKGVLRIPFLEPGTYEVACPRMNVTFHLELRS
jgi:predicted anti-sigma-YlaC factor YlaD